METLLLFAGAAVILVLTLAIVRGVRRGFSDGYHHGTGPSDSSAGTGGWSGSSYSRNDSYSHNDEGSVTGDSGSSSCGSGGGD